MKLPLTAVVELQINLNIVDTLHILNRLRFFVKCKKYIVPEKPCGYYMYDDTMFNKAKTFLLILNMSTPTHATVAMTAYIILEHRVYLPLLNTL